MLINQDDDAISISQSCCSDNLVVNVGGQFLLHVICAVQTSCLAVPLLAAAYELDTQTSYQHLLVKHMHVCLTLVEQSKPGPRRWKSRSSQFEEMSVTKNTRGVNTLQVCGPH
jgi:hypothetical protein